MKVTSNKRFDFPKNKQAAHQDTNLMIDQEYNSHLLANEDLYNAPDKTLNNNSINFAFSQFQIEINAGVLVSTIILACWLLSQYYETMNPLFFYSLIVSLALDLIVCFIIIYIVVELRKDSIFASVSLSTRKTANLLSFLSFLVKLYVFALAVLQQDSSYLFIVLVFKLILDFYFFVKQLHFCIFCPCSICYQESTIGLINTIKYYVFCCEYVDDRSDNENNYSKLEEVNSFY